ncbi:MAG: ribosomal RNA small subunit methyltransferase A, partial [Gammaproteobacteria bacterium]|nr:ribosomal RNA small subunit methyltransferase A [Gammaproteobacteria bacterium]
MVFARKRFGQNFLHDPRVIAQIIEAINPQSDQALVEIGPGRGALTEPLLERCSALDAIEIDRDLAGELQQRLADRCLTLHTADALKFDFAALAASRNRRLRVIGNLPYNVSTPLLFHLLEARASIIDLHIMLQREVIERICAVPASSDYGRLTVMLAPWVTAEHV